MKEVVALLGLFLLWPQASILDNLAVLKISYRILQMLWMVYNKHCCGPVCLIGIRGLENINHLKMTYKMNRSAKTWSEDNVRQLKGSNDLQRLLCRKSHMIAFKNILKSVQFNTFTPGNSASGLSASPAIFTLQYQFTLFCSKK
jgi:hypothetical protein